MTRQRDARLDVLRALALLTIFIDHIPGTQVERLTLRNFGFADAAEAFVLISGIAVGLAYGPKFQPGRRLLTAYKAARRAGVLYCAHIMTTVATLTIFCGASILTARPEFLSFNNIAPLIIEPVQTFVGIGLLGHQLGYNNILSMYAVLMLFCPLLIWGIGKRPLMTLGLCAAIWLVAGLLWIAPPNYPTAGYWFLNPLSWQFLFAIGITAAMYRDRAARLIRSPVVVALSLAYVLGALALVYSPVWGRESWFGLPILLGGFDKTFLALPRLLHALALAVVAIQVMRLPALASIAPRNPLAVLGRHSLPVFILGTVLAMVGQVLKALYGDGFADDAALLATGIGLQFAFAYALEWVARADRGPMPARYPAAPAAASQVAIAAASRAPNM